MTKEKKDAFIIVRVSRVVKDKLLDKKGKQNLSDFVREIIWIYFDERES